MKAAEGLPVPAQRVQASGTYLQQAIDVSQPQQAGQPSDTRVVTKVLVTNAAAGSVIGRNGQNITYYQDQTGARIQLSRAGEFFPGTNDRVMLLAGTGRQVLP